MFLETRDPRAREAIFNANKYLIGATRYRIIREAPDVEDLEQDGAIALLRAIDTYDPNKGTQFKSYAIQCLRFCFIKQKQYRMKRSFKKLPLVLRVGEEQIEEDWIPDSKLGVEEQIIKRAGCERVREVVEGLSEEISEVINLRYWSGLSQRECGEVLKVPNQTVVNRERRALRKLKKELVEDPF